MLTEAADAVRTADTNVLSTPSLCWIFFEKTEAQNVFHKIFYQDKNECEKYDASLLIPRRCKSQIFRDNYPSMTLSIFFGKP